MAATTGTTDQILSLPRGGGDVRGLGETFRPDLHTGTGSYAIPLDIPNGPNDIAPKLTLLYHTGTGSGPFGMGFGLPLLAIARSTDRRIPTYRDPEDALVLVGGGELVPMDGGEFRLRVDDGGWQVRRDGDGFSLTDRDGRAYRLGLTEQARLFTVEDGATKVLRWQLEEIADPLGNRATLTYRRDANQLYLERVDYRPYSVHLGYEPRPDPVVSGRAGFLITTRLRCARIELRLDGSPAPLVRRWQLEYRQSQPAGHSLLSRVTLTGFDDHGRSATLPVLTLDYTAPRQRRLERVRAELPGSGPGAFVGGRRELLDWDGDGLPDLIELGGGAGRVWRNLGGFTWARPASLPSLPMPVALDEPAVAFADMDGNGTADLVMLDRPLPGYYPHRPGGGFDRPVSWRQTPSVRLSDQDARLVDLDGDGIVDILVTGPRAFTLFFRDPAGGWRSRPQSVPRPQAPPVSLDDPRVSLADMNGDGFQDLVRVDGAGVTYWPYLGNGRWADPVTLGNPPELPRRYDPERMFLADIDGDGCADLIYVDSDQVRYWLNQGGTSLTPPHRIAHTPAGAPPDIRLADMNGTGAPGVLWSSTSPGRRTADHFFLDLMGGVKPYLLSRIDNGMGLVTEIDYGSSTTQATRDRGDGRPWSTFLPFPLPVVTGLRATDAATGRQSLSSFRYHDGHFDSALREFAGFARVDVEEAGDESAPAMLTRNWFHIGLEPEDPGAPLTEARRVRLRALRGKLVRTEVYGLDGSPAQDRPYLRTENGWEVEVRGGTGIVAPRLQESRTSHFERRPTPFRVTTTRNLAFDAAGNVTEQEQRAEDPRNLGFTRVLRTTITFAHDPAGRFVSKPARAVQHDAAGRVVATTVSYYDGLPEGEVGSTGLLTRVEARVLTDELVDLAYGATAPDFAGLGYHRRPGEDGWWIDKATYTRTDDDAGLRGTTTNALGRTTLLFFDTAKTQPARVVDVLGNRTDAAFDQRANKLGSLTDANGAAVANRYDPLGRLELVVEPGATEELPSTRHTYETGGAPTAVVTQQRAVNGQPGVIVRKTFFDGGGAVLEDRVVTSGGEIVERGQLYSARGLVREQFLPHRALGPGYTVPAPGVPRRRLRYDALGRLVEVENPDGSSQRQAFEPGVAIISDEEDASSGPAATHAGTPTRHVYDPTGRIMEVVLDDGGTPERTRYRYDVKGNLLEVSDAAGSRATFVYDLLGRRLRTTTPESGSTTFVFDANGNQVERRDARGAAVRFDYDELDRLLKVFAPGTGEIFAAYTYHDTAPVPPAEAGPFTRGRLVKATSPGGETVYAYDTLGRMTRKRLRPTGLPGRELALDVAYRADGQRSSITYPESAPGAGRRVVTYAYDKRGLLKRIPGFVKSVNYNEAGQRERVEYANGVVTTYGYDPATFRVTALRTVDVTGTAIQDLTYSYDLVGNLLRVASPDARLAATYGYDDLYRLTSATTDAGESWGYAYDQRDNLTFKSDVGVYGYDGGGRLVSAGPNILSYTAAGQAEMGPWGEAAYDLIGRLVSITRGPERQAVLYDHDGRRVRAERTGPAGERELMTPDDLVAVDDGILYVFVFDGAARVAQLRLDNGAVGFFHGDHLGSTTLVTGPAGEVLQRVRYDPFGAILQSTVAAGTGGTPYLYTGQLWDDWSELLHLHTRHYSPRLGRLLTADAVAPELYQPQAWNRYSYVQNNPLRYVDPTGHFWEEIGDWFKENWVSIVAVVAIALVVVLTIVTFGAGALVGVGIMMAIGGLVGGVAAAQAGGDILQGVLVGMAVGGAAGFAGMVIGAGMTALFGAKTFTATVLTGALAGAVSGGAMGFAAGFAGGQGSSGDIWEKVWKGAMVGAVSGLVFGFGSYAFGSGWLGTGRFDLAAHTGSGGLGRVALGFAVGSVTEFARQQAFGEPTNWEAVLSSGAMGASLAGFVRFGGDSGLPVLNVLKPEQVGIASSIFAQATSAVFVLDYADDLWRLLAEHKISTAKGGQA